MVSQKQKEQVEQREKAPSPGEEKHIATLIEKRSLSEPATVPPGEARISLPTILEKVSTGRGEGRAFAALLFHRVLHGGTSSTQG